MFNTDTVIRKNIYINITYRKTSVLYVILSDTKVYFRVLLRFVSIVHVTLLLLLLQ